METPRVGACGRRLHARSQAATIMSSTDGAGKLLHADTTSYDRVTPSGPLTEPQIEKP